MPIEKNQVVLFHYSVSDDQSNALENSRGGEPNAYLHGHGGVIRGLEEALEGRDAGDTVSVTVTPEKAYGPRHVLVAKVGHKFADVDTNHPMADKTLTFDIEIIEVRAAGPEEMAHGHAHGPGGHH
jgi:FKBP-type peptidyl-prolyl cis-trans isomerase SlyD